MDFFFFSLDVTKFGILVSSKVPLRSNGEAIGFFFYRYCETRKGCNCCRLTLALAYSKKKKRRGDAEC